MGGGLGGEHVHEKAFPIRHLSVLIIKLTRIHQTHPYHHVHIFTYIPIPLLTSATLGSPTFPWSSHGSASAIAMARSGRRRWMALAIKLLKGGEKGVG